MCICFKVRSSRKSQRILHKARNHGGCCGAMGLAASLEHRDTGLIPGLAQWVRDPALLQLRPQGGPKKGKQKRRKEGRKEETVNIFTCGRVNFLGSLKLPKEICWWRYHLLLYRKKMPPVMRCLPGSFEEWWQNYLSMFLSFSHKKASPP